MRFWLASRADTAAGGATARITIRKTVWIPRVDAWNRRHVPRPKPVPDLTGPFLITRWSPLWGLEAAERIACNCRAESGTVLPRQDSLATWSRLNSQA